MVKMRIKDYKCKCGHDDFFFSDNGNQTGIYCQYCGKWFKWANKDEQNLRMKQESALDKIRAEIIELRSKQNVGVLECLDIIDKYKAEMRSEE
jgi:hypothetical protein